eukprot:11164122-Lingulodinium_polyedra.AAC.1
MVRSPCVCHVAAMKSPCHQGVTVGPGPPFRAVSPPCHVVVSLGGIYLDLFWGGCGVGKTSATSRHGFRG